MAVPALNDVNAVIFADAFCTDNSITDADAIAHWRSFAKLLYAHLKADILITIATGSIATAGTAAAQTGPAAPLLLTPA